MERQGLVRSRSGLKIRKTILRSVKNFYYSLILKPINNVGLRTSSEAMFEGLLILLWISLFIYSFSILERLLTLGPKLRSMTKLKLILNFIIKKSFKISVKSYFILLVYLIINTVFYNKLFKIRNININLGEVFLMLVGSCVFIPLTFLLPLIDVYFGGMLYNLIFFSFWQGTIFLTDYNLISGKSWVQRLGRKDLVFSYIFLFFSTIFGMIIANFVI